MAMSASCADATSIGDGLRAAPIGKIIMASTLTGADVETVCLLQPYQDRLNSGGSVAASLNARLDAEALTTDEAHFTFVIVGKRGLTLDRIKRSTQLDVFGLHRLPSELVLPHDFVQAECASGASAALVKVMFRERAYIVVGEMRPQKRISR
ncbi:hypothetical protein A6U87_22940 [Rhizobium sp. AC44/96]|nr:hypothetical protein A6U87_22940 [Rhizobium sp. AC44/96]